MIWTFLIIVSLITNHATNDNNRENVNMNGCCFKSDIERFQRTKRIFFNDRKGITEHRKTLDSVFREENLILHGLLIAKIKEVKTKFRDVIDSVSLKTENRINDIVSKCFSNIKNELSQFIHKYQLKKTEYLDKLFENTTYIVDKDAVINKLIHQLTPSDEIFKMNVIALVDIGHADIILNIISKYKSDSTNFIERLDTTFTLNVESTLEDENDFERAEYIVDLPDAYNYTNIYIKNVEVFESQIASEIKIYLAAIAEFVAPDEYGIEKNRLNILAGQNMSEYLKLVKNELLVSTSEVLSFFKNSFDAYLFVIFNSINDIYVYFDNEIKKWHQNLMKRLSHQ